MQKALSECFRYLLLKSIYTSFRCGCGGAFSADDMSFKYFLEMTPEEEVINPSSLTKFRKLRLKDTDLLNFFVLVKTVTIAIEKRDYQIKIYYRSIYNNRF